jgi:hypothetical protein
MKLHYSCLMVGSRVQTLVFPWILELQTRHGALSCCAECWSSGGGDAPWTKDACTGGGELPADGWHTASGVHLSYPGDTSRWQYMRGNSSLPRPFATVGNKNIILVVMDLRRSAKLLTNLWWQIELSIRSRKLLAWPPFSLYYYSLFWHEKTSRCATFI